MHKTFAGKILHVYLLNFNREKFVVIFLKFNFDLN